MGMVSGGLSMSTNAISVFKQIRSEQTAFRRDVEKTKKELTATWDKKWEAKLESTSATKKMKELSKKAEPFRKKLVKAVAVKDAATSKIKSITGKLKSLHKEKTEPKVKVKDDTKSGLSAINGKLRGIGGAFKKVAIPVTIAATVATAGLGAAVKSGMELENQQVSMKHFISATNKGMDESAVQKVADEFTSSLRDNANATPFETGEVLASGTRALAVANGDTKEAMSLVKLSEDMAAASGGTKSISDAMEALADAKMGEMERLKEFGFKVSADEFKKGGFSGVSEDLQDFYGGAAEKLAQTGSGLMSTIKGKLKSNFADFGLNIVNKLKPVMQSMVAFIDKSAPALEKFGNMFADKIGKGIEIVSGMVPGLISRFNEMKPIFSSVINTFVPMIPQIIGFGTALFSTMSQISSAILPTLINVVSTILPVVMPVLQTVVTTIGSVLTQAAPIVAGLVDGIGTVISTLAPIFNTIFSAIGDKVGSVISFVSGQMGFVQEVIATSMPVISDILTTAWNVISPIMDLCINVFKIIFGVVKKVFPGIQKVITDVWSVIKPLVEGLGWVIGKLADGAGWIADKLTGGTAEVGSNAKGDNNWRGGLTWVGERGPELVNLPTGSKILPNKESVQWMNNVSGSRTHSTIQTTMSGGGNNVIGSILGNIEHGIIQMISILNRSTGYTLTPQYAYAGNPSAGESLQRTFSVTIAKLADEIIVREDSDIDKMADLVAKKIKEILDNM